MFWGAEISIPEWLEELPVVGDFLSPNGEVIVWNPGVGQKKSLVEKKYSEERVVSFFRFKKCMLL